MCLHSEYGECGTGAYCLGGCDPLSSFTIDSCAPAPVCESKTYKWDDLNNTAINTKYLGNATASDWVYSGEPLLNNGSLLLTMAKDTVGTLMANNHYIWYGKVTGKVKSSRGKGAVTAFILLSDVKDEIDFEFVGSDLGNVQTNYYFQGIPDCKFTFFKAEIPAGDLGLINLGNNAGKEGVDGDTFDTWHTYEIDWTPDYINWSVDGQVRRTLKKEATWNATSNRYQFPQSPARLQMSLWPAGLPTNAEGTIEWAGGVIDWNSEDIKKYGYYYATYGEITVQCYDPPAGANIQGDKSYIYTNIDGLNNSVAITNKDTVLASFGATGTNMSIGAHTGTSTGTGTGTSTVTGTSNTAVASDTVPNIPGGAGAGNVPGTLGNSGSSSGGSGSSTGGDASGTGFSQGGSSTNESKHNSAPMIQAERVLQSSLFAVLVALVVLVTL